MRLRHFPHLEDFTAEDADALGVLLRTFPEGYIETHDYLPTTFQVKRPETIAVEKDLEEFDWAYHQSAPRDTLGTMWGMHYMLPPEWVQQARRSAPEGHDYLWSRKIGNRIFIVSRPANPSPLPARIP